MVDRMGLYGEYFQSIIDGKKSRSSFDHAAHKEDLKEEGITQKFSTKFPMTIVGYERVIPPHETNINELIFKGKEGGMQSYI